MCICIFVLVLQVAMLDPNRYRICTGNRPVPLGSSGLSRHVHGPVHFAAMGISVLGCIVNSVQMLFG